HSGAHAARASYAPEVSVGEAALGDGELSAFTEEVIVVDDEARSVSDASAAGVGETTESSADLAIDLRSLIDEEDEDEAEKDTAVVALDKPPSATQGKP